MMAQQELNTLFEFPCPFPIKIMGRNIPELVEQVKAALAEEQVNLDQAEFNVRESNAGKYLSIGVIFTAESKEQLDRLYQRLTSLPEVKMVL